MLNSDELNSIIRKLNDLKERELPYCKNMVRVHDVVKLLKSYTEIEFDLPNKECPKCGTRTLKYEGMDESNHFIYICTRCGERCYD